MERRLCLKQKAECGIYLTCMHRSSDKFTRMQISSLKMKISGNKCLMPLMYATGIVLLSSKSAYGNRVRNAASNTFVIAMS